MRSDHWMSPRRNAVTPYTTDDVAKHFPTATTSPRFSLHKAAREGNHKALEETLKVMHEQVDNASNLTSVKQKLLHQLLNAKDQKGWTALHYAAQKNNKEICEMLFTFSKVNNSVRTSFMHHHLSPDEEASQLDACVPNYDGVTPIHLVAQGNKLPTEEKVISVVSVDEPRRKINKYMGEKTCLSMLLEWANGQCIERMRDKNGMTPLHWACQRNNAFAALRLLLAESAMNASYDGKYSPFSWGFSETTRENSASLLHSQDNHGLTPLHVCAARQAVETAYILLKMGADLKLQAKYGSTPFHYSVSEGNLRLCKYMLESADKRHGREWREHLIGMRDQAGKTPLHIAAHKGYPEVVELLLEKGNLFLISHVDPQGNTALHYAVMSDCLSIAKILADAAIDINQANAHEMTALHIAASCNHLQAVKFLVEHGADTKKENLDQMTPLLVAAYRGNSEVVEYLISQSGRIADDDIDDRTCLHLAIEANHPNVVKVILSQKPTALLNKTDLLGNTPLHLAAIHGSREIAELLLTTDQCNANMKDENGEAAIHLAAKFGQHQIIKMLLKKYDSQLHAKDEKSNTPLIIAATNGRFDAVKCLVEIGANLDDRNFDKHTALSSCALRDFSKCAKILLEAGASVNCGGESELAPLHVACTHGSPNVTRLLLKHNASVLEEDSDGRRALDLAIKHGHKNCAKVIISSEKWKAALRSWRKEENGRISTPLRQLILTMPDVAETVFSKCTQITPNIGKDDPKYNVEFDFEFLNDDYSYALWQNFPDEGESVTLPNIRSNILGEYQVNTSLKPYCSVSKVMKENHPLALMGQQEDSYLLTHPLVNVLLKYKWMRFGRKVYYTLLSFYIAYLALLTTYFILLPPPYAVTIFGLGRNSCFVAKKEAIPLWNFSTCKCCQYGKYNAYFYILSMALLLLSAMSLVKEIFQMVQRKASYFSEIDNCLELLSYSLTVISIINWSERSEVTGIKEHWQWQIASVCMLTSWITMALFIRKIPSLGIYVIMVFNVFRTFSKFLIPFLVFINGFALFFNMVLQNQYVFHTWWQSLIKITVMMIGELDYGDIFYSGPPAFTNCFSNSSTCMFSNTVVYYPYTTFAFFAVFLTLMPIVVMNLLVGLAVDDIKTVQLQATRQKLAMQIKLALDVEYMMPEMMRKYFHKSKFKIYPNKYSNSNWLLRFFFDDDVTSIKNISRSLVATKDLHERMQTHDEMNRKQQKKIKNKLSQLLHEIEKLQNELSTIST